MAVVGHQTLLTHCSTEETHTLLLYYTALDTQLSLVPDPTDMHDFLCILWSSLIWSITCLWYNSSIHYCIVNIRSYFKDMTSRWHYSSGQIPFKPMQKASESSTWWCHTIINASRTKSNENDGGKPNGNLMWLLNRLLAFLANYKYLSTFQRGFRSLSVALARRTRAMNG